MGGVRGWVSIFKIIGRVASSLRHLSKHLEVRNGTQGEERHSGPNDRVGMSEGRK